MLVLLPNYPQVPKAFHYGQLNQLNYKILVKVIISSIP